MVDEIKRKKPGPRPGSKNKTPDDTIWVVRAFHGIHPPAVAVREFRKLPFDQQCRLSIAHKRKEGGITAESGVRLIRTFDGLTPGEIRNFVRQELLTEAEGKTLSALLAKIGRDRGPLSEYRNPDDPDSTYPVPPGIVPPAIAPPVPLPPPCAESTVPERRTQQDVAEDMTARGVRPVDAVDIARCYAKTLKELITED